MNAKQKEIARLLRVGLDHYGDGDTDAAVRAWNAVLALDPRNADASDYIESVDAGTGEEREEEETPLGTGVRPLLEQVIDLLDAGREIDAFAALDGAVQRDSADLEALAVLELVRARLLPLYRAGFGSDATPRATSDAVRLTALGLGEGALAVHAACDGRTSIEALPAASGLDAFDAFRELGALVDAGLVSVYA